MTTITTLILFIFTLIPTINDQTIPDLELNDNGLYEVQTVIELDDLNAGDIYNNSLQWFAETYRSANDVIQYSDNSTNKIVGRGIFKIRHFASVNIHHIVTIESRDGRVRFTVNSFKYDPGQTEYPLEDLKVMRSKKAVEKVEDGVKDIIIDYINYMENVTISDW